ncbi:MAG: hypothetical protein V1708_01660 [Candidatus Micrarchaeota archaeon]
MPEETVPDRRLRNRRMVLSKADWDVQDTPLQDVEERLKLGLRRRIRNALKTGRKTVLLDSGCGSEAAALKTLAAEFRDAVKSGKLELHGLHLAEDRVFRRFQASHNGSGVVFHNMDPKKFAELGVRPTIIIDNLGSIYHGNAFRLSETFTRDLFGTLEEGGILAFHLPESKVAFVDGRHVPDAGNWKKEPYYEPRTWDFGNSKVRLIGYLNKGEPRSERVFHLRKAKN